MCKVERLMVVGDMADVQQLQAEDIIDFTMPTLHREVMEHYRGNL